MSDLPAPQDTETEAAPLHPALQAFADIPDTPQAQEAAQRSAQQIQAFNSVAAIADGARAAADEHINNINTFQSGLTSFVEKDPTRLPLALDLVDTWVPAIMPAGMEDHAYPIAGDIKGEIARAGIQSLAIQSKPAALEALDLYGEHLSDEDKTHLGSFIDTMSNARAQDHAAQMLQETQAKVLASDTLAHGYLGALNDPGTGDVRFPNNWMRDMMADPRVEPQTKAVLSMAHDRLVRQGDPIYSDPNTVTTLLDRALEPGRLTPTEVWSHAGADLSLADTQTLAGAAFPKTPEQLREVQSVSQTLQSARQIIASPENGLAGQEAYGRFVNWLLPEYRRAGPGSLDPRSDTWLLGEGNNLIQQFLPSPGDVLVNRPINPNRPSLSRIFGGALPRSETQKPSPNPEDNPDMDVGDRMGIPFGNRLAVTPDRGFELNPLASANPRGFRR